MIVYEGYRTKAGPIVTADGHMLDPRYDLQNYRPDGFEWGCPGSGSSQLALAILADHLDNDEAAMDLHQRFKWEVIVNLPKRKWTLNNREIDAALQRIREREVRT